ncbi:MAG: PilW family protein [Pseudomonadota bacterium]|nr:PilW family protein [Pseudomonadota bacterium]
MNMKQQGFSLIELLIAVAMGAIIAIAILSVFSGSASSYLVQTERANIINDATYVMQVVADELSHAGYGSEYIDSSTVIQPVVMSIPGGPLTQNDIQVGSSSIAGDQVAVAFRTDIYDTDTVDCLGANISSNLPAGWNLSETSVINHYFLNNDETKNGAEVATLYCASYLARHASILSDFDPATVTALSAQQPLVSNVADFQVQYGVGSNDKVVTYGDGRTQTVTSSTVDRYIDASSTLMTSEPVYAIRMSLVFMPSDTLKDQSATTNFDLFGETFSRTDANVYFLFQKTIALRNTRADVRDGT